MKFKRQVAGVNDMDVFGTKEIYMVEKAHTAGWLSHLYEPVRQIGQKIGDWFAPKAEAVSIEDAYQISIELPGVKIDDLEILMQDDTLTVRGEKRSSREETGASYFFSEREYGLFERSFRLPADADPAKIHASFADGVVRISVPRAKAETKTVTKVPIHYSYGSTRK